MRRPSKRAQLQPTASIPPQTDPGSPVEAVFAGGAFPTPPKPVTRAQQTARATAAMAKQQAARYAAQDHLIETLTAERDRLMQEARHAYAMLFLAARQAGGCLMLRKETAPLPPGVSLVREETSNPLVICYRIIGDTRPPPKRERKRKPASRKALYDRYDPD